MPKGVATFDCIDGVWVTSRGCLVRVAAALRAGLIEVARTKRTLEGKQTKVELLYGYFPDRRSSVIASRASSRHLLR
jgi:hypothetical protein